MSAEVVFTLRPERRRLVEGSVSASALMEASACSEVGKPGRRRLDGGPASSPAAGSDLSPALEARLRLRFEPPPFLGMAVENIQREMLQAGASRGHFQLTLAFLFLLRRHWSFALAILT